MTEAIDEYLRHRDLVLRLAYDITASWADAEDIAQQVFLRWNRWNPVGEVRNPRACLARIATNQALDVVAARPQGPFGWVKVAWKVLIDNGILRRIKSDQQRQEGDRDRHLSYQQCKRVEIRFREPEEIELDGDHMGEVKSVVVTVDPGALTVQMPADWTP